MIDVRPHSSFLDLACGIGTYSIEIAKLIGAKGSVYAVDLWAEGIEDLNKKIAEQQIKSITTIQADISDRLPIEENSIDSCLLATIIHDLAKSDQQSTIQEVVRLLKSGGMLNILEFKKIEKGPGPALHIRMDEGEIEALVTPYGFTRVLVNDVGDFNYLVKYQKTAV